MCRATILLLTWSIFGLTTATPCLAMTPLRWEFRVGDRFHLTFTQQTDIATSYNDQKSCLALALITEMDWHVEELSDSGEARIAQTFTRFLSRIRPDEQDAVEYDSDSPVLQDDAAIQTTKQLQSLLRAQFTVTMDSRGQILDVSMSEETKKIVSQASLQPRWKRLLTTDGIREFFKHSLIVLPNKPVSDGDAWETRTPVKTPFGNGQLINNYRCHGETESDEKELIRITLSTDLQLPDGGPPTPISLKSREQTGTLFFNRRTGNFERSELSRRVVSESESEGTTINVVEETRLKLAIARVEKRP